ncbi:MAG: hypothetical protein E2O40_02740 [Planctomycetota bacterium]|nr:MAG: hypothetical protein E2O40_02740 [Planctomycetota bacterium]
MVRLPEAMVGILRPILRPLRRWVTTAHDGDPRTAVTPPQQRMARNLADAIDRAVALGLWDHADRLARTAAPLATGYPRLVEPIARLRLAQGDPETALRMIETCRTPPASLRMLRATCQLFLGSRTEAHLDLYRWSARASAPLDARLMLGLMERDGKDATAVRTLLRNLRHLEDPRTLQALLLISTQRQRPEQAKVWADRLRDGGRSGSEGAAEISDLMLQSLGMPGLPLDAEPTTDQANALAMELITFEPAITTLTEAQQRRPHLPTVFLLVRAIEQALPDLSDRSSAMHAMARLSVLLGEYDAARSWAQQGLAANPMSAALVLLVKELGGSPTPPDPSGVVSVLEPTRDTDASNRARRAAA